MAKEALAGVRTLNKITSIMKRNIIILVLGAVIGLAALLAVHLLPTEPMKENVRWSMEMIEKEFSDEALITGYKSTLTGNFTDCLMLEHAIYTNPDRNFWEQALMMYRGESYYDEKDPDGWWPGQSLSDYVNGVSQPREVSYARYWHGYLVVLKPLLMLTTFNNIRLLNGILQLILVGMVMLSLQKKGSGVLAKVFLVSVPFLFFVSTFASMSLSICLYILLFGLLIQCKWDDKMYQKKLYAEFFLIIGMTTSYFDFLTYPLVTLGFPLCVYFYMHGEGLKQDLKKLIGYSAEWFLGYGGLWAAKWIFADLFTPSTTITDALNTVFFRTQSAENTSRITGFFSVIMKNADVYANLGFIVVLLAVLVFFIVKLAKQGIKAVRKKSLEHAVFIFVALLPFAWYFVMQNHSEQHWQFTCRILAVTVFAGIAFVSKVCKETKE